MNTKKRKPLDDALARGFVYGDDALPPNSPTQPTANLEDRETPPEPEPNEIKTVQSTKPSLMSQLKNESPKEATIRLTVDLPESMHQKLSMLAARTRRKKAEIVRFLLDEALKDVEE
jgi:hypothetical protein